MCFLISESPQRLWDAVILALKHVSAAQLSEAVQRGGGLDLPYLPWLQYCVFCLSKMLCTVAGIFLHSLVLPFVRKRSSWNKILLAKKRTACRILICLNTDRFSATWPFKSTIGFSRSLKRPSLLQLVFYHQFILFTCRCWTFKQPKMCWFTFSPNSTRYVGAREFTGDF